MLLLILDLNGTILDSTHGIRQDVEIDGKARYKNVYFRPYMKEFLAWVIQNPQIRVAIWTSNIKANAEALCNLVFTEEQRKGLEFIWSREQCRVFADYSSKKPLTPLLEAGYSREDIFFVDDSFSKMDDMLPQSMHHDIPEFVASLKSKQEDTALLQLKTVIKARLDEASANVVSRK